MIQARTYARRFLNIVIGLAAALLVASPATLAKTPPRKPNVIVILADDLGYGDVGAFGGKLIKTPNIDRMAKEGVKLTTFFSSANICTPSRAGLLTGRYPIRTGLGYEVIQAKDTNGLPLSEVTIAEALKPDYATALIGKWHLGHVPPYWPPNVQGFDLFFGLPYSHDMKPLSLYTKEPGGQLTSEDVDFSHLTQRFFDRGLQFIEDNRDRPFFLELALNAPHEPEVPNPDYKGKSKAANFGDVVEEVDARVGTLLAKLKALGLEMDTLVILTSDNGPWFEGSSGGFRDRKGGAGWEGGYRVPFIARQPGTIPAGVTSNAMAMNIDFLPTIMAWTGKPLPAATIDGKDLSPVLRTRNAPSPHDELVLFNNERVAAVRTKDWKLVIRTYYRIYDVPLDKYGYAQLIDLKNDPAESYNVAALHPDVMKDMVARAKQAQAEFEPLGVKQAPDLLPGAQPTKP